MRPDWTWEGPAPGRAGVFIGWAPLASVAIHLLVIVLLLLLRDSLQRPPRPPESQPLRVTLEPIPKFRVETVLKGGKGGASPGGGGAKAKAALAPGKAGPAAGEQVASPTEKDRARAPKNADGARTTSTPNPPPRAERNETAGPLVADSRVAPRADPSDPSRPFSVERALRDFRRALRAAPSEGGDGGAEGGRAGAGGGFGSPDLPALPPTGFGFGNLQFESRDFDWTDYARQIYVAIWRAWHHRLYLTTDSFEKWGYQHGISILDHQSGVRFTIEKNGQLTGVAVESESGCIPLDDSASAALQEVVLPPLPPDFPRDSEAVHARFIAQGEVRAMRPTLEYLRARGYF